MKTRKIFYGRSSLNKQELSAELQLNDVEEKFGPMDFQFFDKGIHGDADISKREALIEAIDELRKGDTLYINTVVVAESLVGKYPVETL